MEENFSYDCTPIPSELENKYHSADYNCCECNQSDCIYWILYNREIQEDI